MVDDATVAPLLLWVPRAEKDGPAVEDMVEAGGVADGG